MQVTPSTYQDVWRAVCQIPGLTLASVAPDERQAEGAAYEVGVDGWSPSLHALAMQWIAKVDPGAPETLPTRIVHGLRQQLTIQSRRAREGVEIGTALPFTTSGNLMNLERMAHMHADVTAVAALLRKGAQHGWDAATMVRTSIQDHHDTLHREAVDNRGGLRLMDQGIGVFDEMGERFIHLSTRFDSHGAMLNGEVLTVRCDPPPETALVALAGRPAGDLADIDETVNRRTVARAEAHDGFVALHLTPKRIRISKLLSGAVPNTGD